jgi:hypothetical protein
MTPRNPALCLITAIGLAGCAYGPPIKSDLPDSLTVQFNNDAEGMMTMRGGFMHTYVNARCEGDERKASKMSMASEETLATVPLTPGKPLTFSLSTLNAQGFKGNWGCSVTSTFTPAAGIPYRAILQTANDNLTCKLTIMDQHAKVVPATSPEYSCLKTPSGTVRNGERWQHSPGITFLNW